MSNTSLRVLLVSMPWRETFLPNAGLGLLKSVLNEAGHDASVFDANLVFSTKLGPIYSHIAQHTFSEIAFAPMVYDDYPIELAAKRMRRHVDSSLRGFGGFANVPDDLDELLERAEALPQAVAGIICELEELVDWASYDVVGFSCTFNQTMASAALSKALHHRFADLPLIVGGAACDGPMGRALLEAFPWYRAAAVGRAELTIDALVRAVAAPQGEPLPGVVVRYGRELLESPTQPPRAVLDDLPVPNYDEFFDLSRQLGIRFNQLKVPMEASLGCWWGEKNLCTFCGLNATSLKFTQKSPERALREIRELGQRYGVDRIDFTDNILPLNYYDTLVPELARLAEAGERYEFFVEIKTNVTKERLQKLRAAGFKFFQPGIESFSDGILDLMRKGNTAISQMQFIKWCDEMDMTTIYNIIVRSPGETVEDYEEMAEVIPGLIHLTPPSADPMMQLERFSPYFEHPECYGIYNVRPAPLFDQIFPGMPRERLERLVYSFDYDHDDIDKPELMAARARVMRLIARWKTVHRPSLCTYTEGPGWLRIDDRRRGAWLGTNEQRFITLRDTSAALYRLLSEARSPKQLAEELGTTEEIVLDRLRELASQRLVHFNGRKALALAIPNRKRKAFAKTIEDDRPHPGLCKQELRWQPGRALPRRAKRPHERLLAL